MVAEPATVHVGSGAGSCIRSGRKAWADEHSVSESDEGIASDHVCEQQALREPAESVDVDERRAAKAHARQCLIEDIASSVMTKLEMGPHVPESEARLMKAIENVDRKVGAKLSQMNATFQTLLSAFEECHTGHGSGKVGARSQWEV